MSDESKQIPVVCAASVRFDSEVRLSQGPAPDKGLIAVTIGVTGNRTGK